MRVLLIFCAWAVQAQLNVANAAKHPYANSANGREGYRLAGETVNEARLYDFYQRQADHALAEEAQPKLLPAHLGLDAGVHGHWGKHHQNSHKEPRVNDTDYGSLHFQMLADRSLARGAHVAFVSLADDLHTLFDPETLTFTCAWQGDFIYVEPFR